MKTDSWALNYLCVKWASTYVITMPNIGLYIRLMPMKHGRNMYEMLLRLVGDWANETVTAR